MLLYVVSVFLNKVFLKLIKCKKGRKVKFHYMKFKIPKYNKIAGQMMICTICLQPTVDSYGRWTVKH